jgi:hypothetical protein
MGARNGRGAEGSFFAPPFKDKERAQQGAGARVRRGDGLPWQLFF